MRADEEPDGWALCHSRMGGDLWFGPFASLEEAQAWARAHPAVRGYFVPLYLTLDWNR
jgi:hypothetical protein